MLADDSHRVVAQERRPAGDHLVEHGSQGIQVRARRYFAAHGLLWGHVGHCAHHHAFGGKPGAVQCHGQAEVADLGGAILYKPNVARFQVPVDDAPAVGELQATTGLHGDVDGLVQGQSVVVGLVDDSFNVAPAHQLCDHVWLVLLLPKVEYCNDVLVGTQAPHGLSLSLNAAAAGFVQTLGLDQGKSHLPVQQCVVGQIDLLFSAFTEKTLDLVAAIGEGSGLVGRWA